MMKYNSWLIISGQQPSEEKLVHDLLYTNIAKNVSSLIEIPFEKLQICFILTVNQKFVSFLYLSIY